MRHLLLALLLLALPRAAFGLPVGELRRLAAYEAYLVATAVPPTPCKPDGPSRPGVCPECDGSGKVGDGTVFMECGRCGGTGKVSSSAPSFGATPQVIAPPVIVPSMPTPVPGPQAIRSPMPVPQVIRSPGPQWNVEGKNNYSTFELADHLRRVHGVSVDGQTREQLEAMHDNLHNSEVRSAPVIRPPAPTIRSCPNGQCPTSGQSYQSSPRRGIFRR
jgi:hypothetical protein